MIKILSFFILPLLYIYSTAFYIFITKVPHYWLFNLLYLPVSHMHLPGLLFLGPIAPMEQVFLVNLVYYTALNIVGGLVILAIVRFGRKKKEEVVKKRIK